MKFRKAVPCISGFCLKLCATFRLPRKPCHDVHRKSARAVASHGRHSEAKLLVQSSHWTVLRVQAPKPGLNPESRDLNSAFLDRLRRGSGDFLSQECCVVSGEWWGRCGCHRGSDPLGSQREMGSKHGKHGTRRTACHKVGSIVGSDCSHASTQQKQVRRSCQRRREREFHFHCSAETT